MTIEALNPISGQVRFNGVDTRGPGAPFTWQWGDGHTNSGFFPQTHTYTNRGSNYSVRVIAHYNGGQTGVVETVVRFSGPRLTPVTLPSDLSVTVAGWPQSVASRLPGYMVPSQLTWFAEGSFSNVPRVAIEYVLSAAAAVQRDFVNDDFFRPNGAFRQVMSCDPGLAGGMYSLWYTQPVSWAASSNSVGANVEWSSFFHEMGHNITLNSPATHFFGGKIDGNANAIISEALAQVFQHATAYELVNRSSEFGLDESLAAELKSNALASMCIVRNAFERYVSHGAVFQSWNDPGTPSDETVDTFMTVAFKFFEHAETAGQGCRPPLKRLMQALQLFDPDWQARYDPTHDSPAGATFRATLWVAAMSHAFNTDLRSEFEALNFPISDPTYDEIRTAAASQPDPNSTPTHLEMRLLPGLMITGEPSRLYQIDYTTNLNAATWLPLTNIFLASLPQLWIDPAPVSFNRFYRAVKLP